MASSSLETAPHPLCTQCGRAARELDEGKKMSRCTACKTVHYCSAEHQKENWKMHKPACASVSSSKPYNVHIDVDRQMTDNSPWCKPLLDSLTIPFGLIVEAEAADLRAKIRSYIEQGGRFILGGPIANYLSLNLVDTMFSDLGASWKYSGYHRTTQSLNLAHRVALYQNLPGDSRQGGFAFVLLDEERLPQGRPQR
ncbi:hypothetical protein JCM8547_009138 [Rhodosporidiobolus lusitaniae]